MKKKIDAVESLRTDIKREIAHWIALNKYGGEELTTKKGAYDESQLSLF